MTYFITSCGRNWSRIRGRKATACNKSALPDSKSIAASVDDRQACKRKPVCVENLRRGAARCVHICWRRRRPWRCSRQMPARAQDATWSTAPGSSDFNTAANWTPATVPTGTAFFGASTITGLTFNPGAVNSLGGFTFNPGAPAYSFTLTSASTLTFTGAGIVNNSSNAPSFFVPTSSRLTFANSSTAGNAIITNSGIAAAI